ncbi:DUF1641 domain-containing protein [Bacillus piscicola]|uniref:DUF1641 domain-containing protein n=1 Tax=Bacillus piscicola TaxID=1632684 RepID=UPI001F093814|nr:DUF1641 domain-containing protein [Bacillus piscicola]
MAKAITQIDIHKETEQEQQRKAHEALLGQIADNRESIQTTLEILEELQQSGVLDMARSALKMREKIGAISIDTINQPSVHHLIKNSFNVVEFIGKIEPEELERMLNGLALGMERLSEEVEKNEKVSKWGLIKTMSDPHVLSALSYLTAFLNGMGEEMVRKNAKRKEG